MDKNERDRLEHAVIEAAKAFENLAPFRHRYMDYDQQKAMSALRKRVEALLDAEGESLNG